MTDNNLIKAKALLTKYREGACTEEEKAWIENWYLKMNTEQTDLSNEELQADLNDLQSRLPDITTVKRSPKNYPLIAVAASLLMVSAVSVYLFISREDQHAITQPAMTIDVSAGGNKAVLTLSNGKRIFVTDAVNGVLANDKDTKISKTAQGQIIYMASGERGSKTPLFNSIETPRGGQFRVVLPDGSKVFLNAASSLKYPTRFSGNERNVVLSGEAYFEIAHNKRMPFIVKTEGQQVKVLGTHFNVNSYVDEGKIVTTLAEGSVQVQNGSTKSVIRPGQQSILGSDGSISIQQADMQIALAWKNNELAFKDASIKEVMRQIARWYDLEIEYKGTIPDDTITGSIDRQSNLSTVLKMFDTIQIHFTLEENPTGKKLIIKP